ncbi:hypothetical protein GCM10027280_32410 [Micromonospora polyrhachis]|uniref:Uncharacterized protein n=1 Tax=Micromonospora polyrhachis TaxID=1282883 RepID=A0A7W7STW1_9ACTN|nr:hypothetical protein [Micromonospora polyrhachis]MBB4960834.1 hypothetical protein [Micromonospora polyrhachis]
MFGTSLLDRRSKPERIADHAWEQVLSTVNSAGDLARDSVLSAKRATAHLADGAGDRVAPVANEAWHRATSAVDALAGRRPGLPWGWLIGAGLAGAAIGWAVGAMAQAVMSRAEAARTAEHLEFVDADSLKPPTGLDI